MAAKRTLVVVLNDLHVGSPFALCPARWLLPTGQWLLPNEIQAAILAFWCKCWQRIGELRKHLRLVVIVVGDVVEGLHHESTEIETGRLDVQEAMAVACLESGLKLAKFGQRGNTSDTLYFIKGTPAHDGLSGESMERVARSLACHDAQDSRQCATDTLQRSVNGVTLWVIHKPASGPGGRAQNKGNAFAAWLKSLYISGLEDGNYPRYLFSAHYHEYVKRNVYNLTNSAIVTTGYILPSWKCKDAHGASAAPFAMESIGMVALDIDVDGTTKEHEWLYHFDRAPLEEL